MVWKGSYFLECMWESYEFQSCLMCWYGFIYCLRLWHVTLVTHSVCMRARNETMRKFHSSCNYHKSLEHTECQTHSVTHSTMRKFPSFYIWKCSLTGPAQETGSLVLRFCILYSIEIMSVRCLTQEVWKWKCVLRGL